MNEIFVIYYLRSSLFWDVTQRLSLNSNRRFMTISLIFEGQAVQDP